MDKNDPAYIEIRTHLTRIATKQKVFEVFFAALAKRLAFAALHPQDEIDGLLAVAKDSIDHMLGEFPEAEAAAFRPAFEADLEHFRKLLNLTPLRQAKAKAKTKTKPKAKPKPKAMH